MSSGGGFVGAVSVMAFKLELWLKGDPVRQVSKAVNKVLQRDRDDDINYFVPRGAQRLFCTPGDSSASEVQQVWPWRPAPETTTSPTPPPRPPLTPASAAAIVVAAVEADRAKKNVEAKRRLELEKSRSGNWFWETCRFFQGHQRRPSSPWEEEEDEDGHGDPGMGRLTLDTEFEIEKGGVDKDGETDEEDFPTPPVTPCSSPSTSASGAFESDVETLEFWDEEVFDVMNNDFGI